MKLKLIPTLAFLLLLPVLIALGRWQWERAEEKQRFLQLQTERLDAPVMALTAENNQAIDLLKYKTVIATGQYDEAQQIFLDNQIYQGKAGYFVLTPFILSDSNKAILVNRGWVPGNGDRRILPDIAFKSNAAQVSGKINSFPAIGIKLPGADIPGDTWPAVVQVANSDELAKRLGYPLFDFQLELAQDQPYGYVRDWHTNKVMPPEQHKAYALQWFGLAFTLSVLFVWYSYKNNNDTAD